jgi:hypothetical protein
MKPVARDSAVNPPTEKNCLNTGRLLSRLARPSQGAGVHKSKFSQDSRSQTSKRRDNPAQVRVARFSKAGGAPQRALGGRRRVG